MARLWTKEFVLVKMYTYKKKLTKEKSQTYTLNWNITLKNEN